MNEDENRARLRNSSGYHAQSMVWKAGTHIPEARCGAPDWLTGTKGKYGGSDPFRVRMTIGWGNVGGAYANMVNMTESRGRDWTGPVRRPETASRRKTVTVAESWLPQRTQRESGERVKWRGVLPPQGMRWTRVSLPSSAAMEKTTSVSSPRLEA